MLLLCGKGYLCLDGVGCMNRSIYRKRKVMRKKNRVVVSLDGDPCPRCGQSTEIREHGEITSKHLRQPYYYTRWFNCINPRCRTTLIMPERYRVWKEKQRGQESQRLEAIKEQLAPYDDEDCPF
jgi:hypothetical protein